MFRMAVGRDFEMRHRQHLRCNEEVRGTTVRRKTDVGEMDIQHSVRGMRRGSLEKEVGARQ